MSYVIYQNKHDIAQTILIKLSALSHLKQDVVHIAVSGGSTPKDIFELIKNNTHLIEINWEKLHFWWVDERCVDMEDPENNGGEADRLLFKHVDIPRENLHFMEVNIDPHQAALRYVQALKKQVPLENKIPCFDWVWLGMGDDGHTASLFVKGVPLSSEKWVEIASHPVSKQLRLTLTLKIINHAKRVDFLVTGESKTKMIQKIFNPRLSILDYPARAVSPENGQLTWHIDQAAAGKIVKVSEVA